MAENWLNQWYIMYFLTFLGYLHLRLRVMMLCFNWYVYVYEHIIDLEKNLNVKWRTV